VQILSNNVLVAVWQGVINMNIYNYLYNISLLEVFIAMERWELNIEQRVFGNFRIYCEVDYSIHFDKRKHLLNFEYFRCWLTCPKEFYIEYSEFGKKFKLIWHHIG
jgi:hypothetical protein